MAIAQADTPKPATEIAIPEGVTFPEKIDAKFSSETPAKQRMKTCLDAYHANKAANTLGDLRWVQKGGGYFSLCTARLKATAQ
ncbi:MAG: hypothetical protein M9924_09930 [Rhizobiaceae bacterium]|nr:hypothetical protein [Rhizobiaceae bacterium]